MVKGRIALRNVQNVAAGKTALIDLPVGLRYHYVQLQHGYASGGADSVTGARDNIKEIRVTVNGRVQRRMSGKELRDMNILNGTGYDFGPNLPITDVLTGGTQIPIFFAEPWRKDAADQDALAWPSAGWNAFQIEVDLDTTGVGPVLTAFAAVDGFVPQTPAKGIVKWIRYQTPAGGTSFDISTIDRKDWLQQISLYKDSGGSRTISKVTLRKDGAILHELTGTSNTGLLNHFGMTPGATGRTAGIYDLVLDHDDLLGSAVNLNGASDVTLTVEAGAAMSGTTVAIVQRLGPPD